MDIDDTTGKWATIRFNDWPENLQSQFTGLGNVNNRWLQFKISGSDFLGIWLENPYFDVELAGDLETKKLPQNQVESLEGKAFVLVKWEYIAAIIYLEGKMIDKNRIPIGFDQMRNPGHADQ